MDVSARLNAAAAPSTQPPAVSNETLSAAGGRLDPAVQRDSLELGGTERGGATDSPPAESDSELRERFQDFVGQTLFGSMLASMRETVGKPAYLHGGQTEEIFQKQLDQYIVEDLSDSTAQTISDPMFELFHLQRRS